MKPTFKANIGGYAFTLEEDAYLQLSNYLTLLKKHFANNPECDEIIKDIEFRMSELLRLRLNKEQTVVSAADAQEIISIMGNPKEFGDNEENEPNSNTDNRQAENKDTKEIKKRLYRDPSQSILGGIFGGLGHYFRIDPVALRVIYIALFFLIASLSPKFGFFLIVLYLIMWIIMPKADTFHKRLSMMGTDPSIENIEGRNAVVPTHYRGSIFRTILKTIVRIVCGIIAFMFFIAILSIIISTIWFSIDNQLIGLNDYLAILGFNTLNVKISLILVLLLPLIGGFYLSFKGLIWSRFTIRDLVLSLVCILILIGSSLFLGNSSYNYAKTYKYSLSATEVIPLQTLSDTIYLKLDEKYLGARPAPHIPNNDNIYVIKDNNINSLFVVPNICIKQDSTVNSLEIKIVKQAHEETLPLARKKAENAKLNYVLNNAQIIFEPQLYNKNHPWNAEQFSIFVYAPINKTIITDSFSIVY